MVDSDISYIMSMLVVSLRQLERQLERNSEKFVADSSRLQQECEQQVQQLKTKLENLQAENNLLMVSCVDLQNCLIPAVRNRCGK